LEENQKEFWADADSSVWYQIYMPHTSNGGFYDKRKLIYTHACLVQVPNYKFV